MERESVNSGGVGVGRSARSLPLWEDGFGGNLLWRKGTDLFPSG